MFTDSGRDCCIIQVTEVRCPAFGRVAVCCAGYAVQQLSYRSRGGSHMRAVQYVGPKKDDFALCKTPLLKTKKQVLAHIEILRAPYI
jgi:hypothetical protein